MTECCSRCKGSRSSTRGQPSLCAITDNPTSQNRDVGHPHHGESLRLKKPRRGVPATTENPTFQNREVGYPRRAEEDLVIPLLMSLGGVLRTSASGFCRRPCARRGRNAAP